MTPQTRPDDQPADRANKEVDSASVPPRVGPDEEVKRGTATRTVDQRVIDLVRAAGAESKLAGDLQKEFCDLGFGTLVSLDSKALLFRRLVKMRIFLPPPPPAYRSESRALIYLSVYTAAPDFMVDYVFGDEWDPRRASLHTCFVNACLCQFAREYRRYVSEERRSRGEEPDFEDQFEPDIRQHYAPRPPPDPQVQVIDRTEIERLLSIDMSPHDKIMFVRTAQGFSQAEIADELGLTKRAVSSRMRRNRKRIADNNRNGETDGTTS